MNLIKHFTQTSAFDFVGLRKFTLIFSAILVIASGGLFFAKGLNLGVDFRGGILIEVQLSDASQAEGLRGELNGLGLGDVGLRTFGSEDVLLITLPHQVADTEEQAAENTKAAIDSVRVLLGDRASEYRRTETVGPTVSGELIQAAFWATVYALIGIAIYIAFRFEWRFALAALAALMHDVITTLGLFVVFQFEFNLATVAAILTIAGYSINDTVVVFDRAREELRKYKQLDTPGILNIALNRTLSRTTMTSVTTLIALASLAVFGPEVIKGFSIALIWGVIIGTYSSLFLATPLLLAFSLQRSTFDESEEDQEDGAAAFVRRMDERGKG